MSEAVEYLDIEDLIGLAVVLLGDPPPIRDAGLLELNGVEVTKARNDDVYELVMRVAASQLGVDDIAQGLRTLVPS